MGNKSLSHSGIKGQKWGVRRFQNEDRTWTAAGKERYGSKKNNVHSDYARAHTNKRIQDMSDKELRDVNNRLQMEQQYRSLKMNSSTVMRGMAYVAAAGGIMATGLTMYNNTDKIIGLGKKAITNLKERRSSASFRPTISF